MHEEVDGSELLSRNKISTRCEPMPLFYKGTDVTPAAQKLLDETHSIFAGRGAITDKMPKYVSRSVRHRPALVKGTNEKTPSLINYI